MRTPVKFNLLYISLRTAKGQLKFNVDLFRMPIGHKANKPTNHYKLTLLAQQIARQEEYRI